MRTHRQAFTLIETMVALGIMVLIASLAWSTMAGTAQMREYLTTEDEITRAGQTAIDRLSRELSLAYLTEHTAAVNTYRTVFIGRDDGDADTIWFASRAHRRAYRGARESDASELTIFTEKDPQVPSLLALLHRESPRVDHEPARSGAVLPLATGVTRFDLRYLEGKSGDWLDEWDSTSVDHLNRLPRAIQIVLTLMGPDPDDEDDLVGHTWVRTVLVESAEPLTRSLLAGDGSGGAGSLQNMGGRP